MSDKRWTVHPLMEELKRKAKQQGLWNLYIPSDMAERFKAILPEGEEGKLLSGPGLTNLVRHPPCFALMLEARVLLPEAAPPGLTAKMQFGQSGSCCLTALAPPLSTVHHDTELMLRSAALIACRSTHT